MKEMIPCPMQNGSSNSALWLHTPGPSSNAGVTNFTRQTSGNPGAVHSSFVRPG
ncbi:hypothetical protein [Mesorhizobium sp. L-8-3]|uniref:hypothetical protein n=1 Tax=Mesorhizobium sp. L-8-3 TaxID=2744522 RepID=UPI001925212E|nr:hypothetical protein [Mesorhizobium sp. L-8-3]